MSASFLGTSSGTASGSSLARSSAAFGGRAVARARIQQSVPGGRVLVAADLEQLIGIDTVDQLADVANSGLRDWTKLARVMRQAEDEAAGYLMQGWPDPEAVWTVLRTDSHARAQAAWIACEFLTEGRPAFTADDGKGKYWVQYERSLKNLSLIAKARKETVAKGAAGESAQAGGRVNPATRPSTGNRFQFAPDRRNPRRGGY